jgi:hypothetical protein
MATNSLFINTYSRYQGTVVYQDSASGQLFYGPWQSIIFPQAPDDSWIQIRTDDGLRLDNVSQNAYGTPALWWVIAEANDISNPFTQVYGIASYARSPLIFSIDSRPCFYATSKNLGNNYNVDSSLGITFTTTATTLVIRVAGRAEEVFLNLSPYPQNIDGSTNLFFWGAVNSNWININWVSPDVLQPAISGITGPTPASVTSYLTGGVDEMIISLRVPSINNVMNTLSASAAGNNS